MNSSTKGTQWVGQGLYLSNTTGSGHSHSDNLGLVIQEALEGAGTNP